MNDGDGASRPTVRRPPLIPRKREPPKSRRRFLVQGLCLVAGGAALGAGVASGDSAWSAEHDSQPVRPPTADPDDARFVAACVRCGLCGTVCENGCILFFGLDASRWGALTPYLDVRRRSCTLCMRCTEICPTSALRVVPAKLPVIFDTVRMGVAVVDEDRCLSFLGRACGYCHDACPMPRRAIRLMPPARPQVITDGCTGCGRCVEHCPAVPTAIDVDPTRNRRPPAPKRRHARRRQRWGTSGSAGSRGRA